MCVKSFKNKIKGFQDKCIWKKKNKGSCIERPMGGQTRILYNQSLCVCVGGGGGIVSDTLFQGQGHSEWSKVTYK